MAVDRSGTIFTQPADGSWGSSAAPLARPHTMVRRTIPTLS
jgi:hypothetical protein